MRYVFIIGLIIGFGLPVYARTPDAAEIDSITVLADPRLAVPLTQIASDYTRKNMVTVTNAFGNSENQFKRIEDGESADIFITSNPQLIQELKIKGMADVYSIGKLVSNHDSHFVATLVAGENMTQARKFLAYLKSPEAQAVFKQNALSIP